MGLALLTPYFFEMWCSVCYLGGVPLSMSFREMVIQSVIPRERSDRGNLIKPTAHTIATTCTKPMCDVTLPPQKNPKKSGVDSNCHNATIPLSS